MNPKRNQDQYVGGALVILLENPSPVALMFMSNVQGSKAALRRLKQASGQAARKSRRAPNMTLVKKWSSPNFSLAGANEGMNLKEIIGNRMVDLDIHSIYYSLHLSHRSQGFNRFK